MRRSTFLASLLAVVAAGCWLNHGDDDDDFSDGDADTDTDADTDADCLEPPSAVDLLLMIDDNGAMAQEQAALTNELHVVTEGLTEATGLESLHVGVVSQDMGTGGFAVQTCPDSAAGDDGVLKHEPSDELAGCAAQYPTYLSWSPGDDALQVYQDLACIATLGTGGCGWQQPLAAVRKALTTHRDGANAGFLRDDSLLAILLMANEDDCSIDQGNPNWADIFNTQLDLGPLNLRCHDNPEYVEPVESFVEDLLELRACPVDLAIFGLVGVPPSTANDCNLSNMSDPDFECVLDLPLMQEVIDQSAQGRGERLTPSCDVAGMGQSFPPRRIVQTIRGLGDAGAAAGVGTICEPDFGVALGRFVDALGARLGQ